MGLFRSKAVVDLETVRRRLAELDADIAAVEGRLAAAALSSVLADDGRGDAAAVELSALHLRRGVLLKALATAEAAHAARGANARHAAALSRVREFNREVDGLAAAAEQYSSAIAAAAAAWREMVRLSGRAHALLPRSLNRHSDVLLVPAVGHACELERARLGRPRNSEAAPLPATASVSPRIEYWALEPLADRLKQTGNFCAKMLGEALGLAPPVRVEPRAEPLLIAGPPGSRAEPEPRAKETIDGR